MDDQFKNIDLVATWARNAASIIERLPLMYIYIEEKSL
jgi:hypothetical protein